MASDYSLVKDQAKKPGHGYDRAFFAPGRPPEPVEKTKYSGILPKTSDTISPPKQMIPGSNSGCDAYGSQGVRTFIRSAGAPDIIWDILLRFFFCADGTVCLPAHSSSKS